MNVFHKVTLESLKKNRVRTIESVKESKLNGWKMEIQNN